MIVVRAHQLAQMLVKGGGGSGHRPITRQTEHEIHAVADATERMDITAAEPLLNKVEIESFIADEAYDAGPFSENLKQ